MWLLAALVLAVVCDDGKCRKIARTHSVCLDAHHVQWCVDGKNDSTRPCPEGCENGFCRGSNYIGAPCAVSRCLNTIYIRFCVQGTLQKKSACEMECNEDQGYAECVDGVPWLTIIIWSGTLGPVSVLLIILCCFLGAWWVCVRYYPMMRRQFANMNIGRVPHVVDATQLPSVVDTTQLATVVGEIVPHALGIEQTKSTDDVADPSSDDDDKKTTDVTKSEFAF